MIPMPSMEHELEREIGALCNVNARLTLIAVAAPHVPFEVLRPLVRAAAGRTDTVGVLRDGRLAVLALRPAAGGDGSEVEDRFLGRLHTLLLTTPFGRGGGKALQIRTVHRLTSSLSCADDMIDSLSYGTVWQVIPPPRRPAPALRLASVALALALALSVQGCAGVGLTLFGAGAGVGAGTAVDHTLNGIASKTFPTPMAEVRQASLKSLNTMGFQVVEDKASDQGRTIHAKSKQRDVSVELEQISARATRMRVTADQDDLFFRDAATATEIIVQTAEALDQRQMAARR